jgi:hypothetical protein
LGIVKDDALIVHCSYRSAPRPAAAPAPAQAPDASAIEKIAGSRPLPQTLPPSIVWVGGLGDNGEVTLMKPVLETHEREVTETVKTADGEEQAVTKKVAYVVSKLVPETRSLKEPVVFAVKDGAHGEQLSAQDARNQLKSPQSIVIAFNGTPDDRYLSIFKDQTPVLLLAQQPVAPAKTLAPPPPGSEAPPLPPTLPTFEPTGSNNSKPVTPAPARPQTKKVASPTQAKKFRDTANAHFASGEFREAAKNLEQAREHEPNDALLCYLLAYMQHRAGLVKEAEQSVATAAELEAGQPIGNWGTRMERYQGPSRHWLEAARQK